MLSSSHQFDRADFIGGIPFVCRAVRASDTTQSCFVVETIWVQRSRLKAFKNKWSGNKVWSCHIPFSPFLCSLIWSLVLLFWLALDFMMPWHFIMFSLFHYLQPPSLRPLSTFPSSITLSLCHPHSCPLSSITLITSFYLHVSQLLASPFCPIFLLSSQHLFITPCLTVLTLSTLYSIPCDSVSHILHSPYYPVRCPTLSLVVCKSFQFVVYPSACNCCPLFPTQSPLSLPQSPINLSPYNTIPLCLPCLSPPKLRTPLFLSEGATHKLKPSPYPYAAIFCSLSTALRALHYTPSTFLSAHPGLWGSFDLIPSSFCPLLHSAFIPSLPQHSTFHLYYS